MKRMGYKFWFEIISQLNGTLVSFIMFLGLRNSVGVDWTIEALWMWWMNSAKCSLKKNAFKKCFRIFFQVSLVLLFLRFDRDKMINSTWKTFLLTLSHKDLNSIDEKKKKRYDIKARLISTKAKLTTKFLLQLVLSSYVIYSSDLLFKRNTT